MNGPGSNYAPPPAAAGTPAVVPLLPLNHHAPPDTGLVHALEQCAADMPPFVHNTKKMSMLAAIPSAIAMLLCFEGKYASAAPFIWAGLGVIGTHLFTIAFYPPNIFFSRQ